MNFYSTKSKSIQRLRALAKKLGNMVEDGSFFQLEKPKQLALRQRLADLYREVRAVFSVSRVRRMLASSALILGLATTSQAQYFSAPVAFDNGMQQQHVPIPHFADIDGDGDQDVIMSLYGGADGDSTRVVAYQENTGTPLAPSFGALTESPWNIGISFMPTTIDFADVDNDGDLDLFIGSYDWDDPNPAPIHGWENTGTATNPLFNLAPAVNPFSFQPSAELSEVTFVDLDGDGDEDVLMNDYQSGNDYEQFRYQKNLGVMPTFPVYEAAQINPFGLENMEVETYIMSFDDLDNDGDQDLLIAGGDDLGTVGTAFYFYENTGTATEPAFAMSVTNPFNLMVPENTSAILPDFVDIDGDGDTDIVATIFNTDTYDSGVFFYENLGEPSSAKELSAINQLNVFPTVADVQIYWSTETFEDLNNNRLQIIDIHGQVLYSEKVKFNSGVNQGAISVANFASGMYVLNVTSHEGKALANQKFFVK